MTPTIEQLEEMLARHDAGEALPFSFAVKNVRQILAQIRTLEAENKAMREVLGPFARVASTLSALGPDGMDDGLTVLAHIHARPEREEALSTADFTRAAALLKEK